VTACGTGAPRLASSASAVGARGATARLGVAAGSGQRQWRSAAQGRPDPSSPSCPRGLDSDADAGAGRNHAVTLRSREKPRTRKRMGQVSMAEKSTKKILGQNLE